MGINLSSISSNENLLAANLISSQLISRQTLSTCYDAIFDISLNEEQNFLLISDDGRLRLFEIDETINFQLNEKTSCSTNRFLHEQIHEIIWCSFYEQFLILTSKRLILYDQEMNLVDIDLSLEKSEDIF